MNIKENFRLELHNEIRKMAPSQAAVNWPGLLKYQGFEHCGTAYYLVRTNREPKGIQSYRPGRPEEILQVLQEVIAVMAAFHQQGLVCGGVSIGQLKTDSAGSILLQDPPVLNRLSPFLSGDYGFSLPAEVVKGAQWDRQSDVFSWGELAYKLFTGKEPFAADEPEDRAAKLVKGLVVNPRIFEPRLSEKLSQLILSCLAVEPRKRPTPEQLGKEYAALLAQGEGLVSAAAIKQFKAKSELYQKKQQSRERRWLWWRKHWMAVAAVTVVLVLLLSFFLTPKNSRITKETTPLEVVNYYFEGIKTVNVSLIDDTLYKVKDNLSEIMANIHVINATRKAAEYNIAGENAIKVVLEEFKLTKERETATAAQYKADYTIKLIAADEVNYLSREDRFYLNPVRKKWRITKITNLKQKRWTEKLIPAQTR